MMGLRLTADFYSAAGEKITRFTVEAKSRVVRLSLKNIPARVYFVRVYADGKTLCTSKIVGHLNP
jgi:hypothetical protein